MKQYLNLLKDIKENGEWKSPAREGMPRTKSIFTRQLRFDLQEGFPAITSKKLFWKGVVGELLWFLRGDTDIKYLVDNDINIWNDDCYKYFKHLGSSETKEEWLNLIKSSKYISSDISDCGDIYGYQWRNWNDTGTIKGFDQIQYLIKNINKNPDNRYHVVTAWNPTDFLKYKESAALPACHMLFQCYIRSGVYLDLSIIQRSCDSFLGIPMNIASYSLLTYMLADLTGYQPGELIWTGHDIHYYENHQEQIDEILTRQPYKLPTLLNTDNYFKYLQEYKFDKNLDNFLNNIKINDFILGDYEYHPTIKAPLSVGI